MAELSTSIIYGDLTVTNNSYTKGDMTIDGALTVNGDISCVDISISNPVDVYNLDHDSFSGFVANEHVDHTSVSILTSGIVSGGGDLTANRTITLNHSDVDHDQTTNFLATEHRQWENSITQNVHDDNITSSSITQHEADINHNNLTNTHQDVTTGSTPSFSVVTITGSVTNGTDATPKDYVDGLIQGLDWQESVIDRYDPSGGLPSSPTEGDRYISTASANGWTADYIYEYDGSSWIEIIPDQGTAAWVEDEGVQYTYNGTGWVKFASIYQHNNLSGLDGGATSEYYHLDATEYGYLDGQNQSVQTTSSVTFDDVSITTPSDIYTDLNHDSFTGFVANEHIDWTASQTEDVHDDNIAKTAITQYSYTYGDFGLTQGLVSIDGVSNAGGDVDLINGGNVTITSDNTGNSITLSVPNDLTVISNYSTTDLSEGTNLYYTDSRVDAHLTGGTGIDYSTGSISIDSTVLQHSDVDDTPVDAATDVPVSSNWAYNHANDASAHHTRYALTEDLASGEITQLQNINSVTITNTQWGYLGGMSGQPIESSSEVDHDSTTNFVANEHIDWTASQTEDVHDNNIAKTAITQYSYTYTDLGLTEYTDADAEAAINADTDHGSTASHNYYTDSNVDAHLTGGTGIDYSAGTISIDSTVVQTTDTDISGNSWVLDEDGFTSNSATKVATQQSIKAYVDANAGGGGGGLSWSIISTNQTLASGNGYLADCSSSALTLDLPASPTEGDQIAICDYTSSSETNNITVGRNGSNIEGLTEDLIIDINGAGFTFVYSDASRGWEIVSEVYTGPDYGNYDIRYNSTLDTLDFEYNG